MTRLVRRFSVLVLAFAATAVWACSPAPTATTSGEISITNAWTMATPPGAGVAVGYMTIQNQSGSAVRLMGGQTPAAERVEVHTMSMEGGVMRMRPVEGGLAVPAGGAVELKPSGMHMMMMGLQRPLVEGETVPLTLMFDNGTRIDVALAVRAMGGGNGH